MDFVRSVGREKMDSVRSAGRKKMDSVRSVGREKMDSVRSVGDGENGLYEISRGSMRCSGKGIMGSMISAGE